jgi:hypothetical protein
MERRDRGGEVAERDMPRAFYVWDVNKGMNGKDPGW